ncbi:hypothetical protein G9F73_012570 [Clostridium estertheticum]|uniref:hypothetical protein n=1 Tax=Clostridium estertheticum TaxID=238834 RepID=UPI0013EE867B|nr:hypothetical protein [Clostridium estertheticum]MBZ9608643.1 hypothetical protein [Clostridium estertheticum]
MQEKYTVVTGINLDSIPLLKLNTRTGDMKLDNKELSTVTEISFKLIGGGINGLCEINMKFGADVELDGKILLESCCNLKKLMKAINENPLQK